MTKQLDDMWTTSWVLPEHREALIEDNQSIKRKIIPELDEYEILQIDQVIYASLKQNRILKLQVFGEYANETIVGTVIKVASGIKQVKILLWDPEVLDSESKWIFIDKVLKAELNETFG